MKSVAWFEATHALVAWREQRISEKEKRMGDKNIQVALGFLCPPQDSSFYTEGDNMLSRTVILKLYLEKIFLGQQEL